MQGYARGPSYDYNTVRDSENVNGIRDLTQLRDAGFAKIWVRMRD